MLAKLRDRSIEAIIYRDDGALINYTSPRVNQRQVTVIRDVFSEEGLNITIEGNLSVLNFLDVTLDLTNGEH